MPVFSGSRYSGARQADILFAGGERRPYVYGRKVYGSGSLGPGTTTWQYEIGDSFDQVALAILGTELRWWLVADVNSVLFPEFDESLRPSFFSIFIGRNLLVPTVDVLVEGSSR